MKFLLLSIFFTALSFVFQANAQEEIGKARIEKSKPVKVEYGFHAWNKNPNAADSASIIFRDANSGKLAKIELQETGDATNFFVGQFSISWETGMEIVPEIYVVSQKMMTTADSLKNIESLIKDGRLLRKPYFVKILAHTQAISVFDTKQQAMEALTSFRKTSTGKSIVDPAALEAQRKAQQLAEQNRLAELAKQQENERKRLDEIEKERKEELKRQQALMDEAERARRKARAKTLAAEAMELYKKEKYSDAEKKFSEAVDLDPNSTSIYYQFGVTLYKLEKYQKSLVVLDSAKGADVNEGELLYYKGLNHMKLKEYDTAKAEFETVKNMNNKGISPSAAFLGAIIDFQKEKYEEAKKGFEWVLDNSEDPKMDQQADAYIEQIANIMAFESERKKKFIFTVNFGVSFDSNILAVSNSQIDAGSATGLDGYRWMYGGSIERRMVYGPTHEFSAILNVSDMYSQDKTFKAAANFQNTDPLSMSLATPYKYKGMFGSKPYQLGLTPSYETINMNQDGSGSREAIVASTVMKADQTFVMSEDWFSAVNLEYRSDAAKVAASSAADDQNATKMTLATSNTFFQDKKKTEAWIADLGLANNAAKGDNTKYNRYDLAATYMMPVLKDAAMTFKVGYYNAAYGSHLVGRSDINTALTISYSQPLTETLRLSASANYTINKSTLASSDYKKYSVMTMLSWNGFVN